MNVCGKKRGMKPWNFPGRVDRRRKSAAQRNIKAVQARVDAGPPDIAKAESKGEHQHRVRSYKNAVTELEVLKGRV